MLEGNRKILFFILVLLVASLKLDGLNLSNVLIGLVTFFGIANGVEHYSRSKDNYK